MYCSLPVGRRQELQTAAHQLLAYRGLQDGPHVPTVQRKVNLGTRVRHTGTSTRTSAGSGVAAADADRLGQQGHGAVDLAADLLVGHGVTGDQRARLQVLQLLLRK